MFDMLRHDCVMAVRSLSRQPGFPIAVVLTLALAAGANAAVLTLVDAVLLRPLPISHPQRVVGIFTTNDSDLNGVGYGLDDGLSYSAFRAVEGHTRSLTAVAGFVDVEVGLRTGRGVTQLNAAAVSGSYFSLLGLRPSAGRWLGTADDSTEAPGRVVVLSDRLWLREFDRAPDVVGRAVEIGGTPFTIVGVAPEGFRGTRLAARPDLWFPLSSVTAVRAGGLWIGTIGERMLSDHPLAWVGTIGRLADGVTSEAAAGELAGLIPSRGADTPAGPARNRLAINIGVFNHW